MDINDFKKQYESITASEELKMKANREMKKSRFKNGFKISGSVAAALVVAVGVAANASPAFASAMSEVPGLSGIVKVITFGRYENAENGVEIKVETPKIEGLIDVETQEKLNKEFDEQAQNVIAAFEKSVKEFKEEFGDETVHMGFKYGYEVKTDTEDILALDTYVFYAAGSSMTVHNFYTIDKNTGEIYTLESMFEDGADYVSPISEYIKKEMIRMNNEEEAMFWVDDEIVESFEKISSDQNFYINSDGNVVICFDKYEVAPGAQGSPEFVIPNELIADILK